MGHRSLSASDQRCWHRPAPSAGCWPGRQGRRAPPGHKLGICIKSLPCPWAASSAHDGQRPCHRRKDGPSPPPSRSGRARLYPPPPCCVSIWVPGTAPERRAPGNGCRAQLSWGLGVRGRTPMTVCLPPAPRLRGEGGAGEAPLLLPGCFLLFFLISRLPQQSPPTQPRHLRVSACPTQTHSALPKATCPWAGSGPRPFPSGFNVRIHLWM